MIGGNTAMEQQGFSAESPVFKFLEKHLLQTLVFETEGNPFLIGTLLELHDCHIAAVQENAGYITLIPIDKIVEIHTITV
jgi:hypothetical protein